LGRGDGTFQTAVNYNSGRYPQFVAIGDFNGDGKSDLAVANTGSYPNFTDGSVAILLGNGDGTFQKAVNYDAGPYPASVAVGDFNGDGNPDLAVANVVWYDQSTGTSTNGGVSLLFGKGDGTFKATVKLGAGRSPHSVAVNDFNGDGKADIAVANVNSGDVSVLLGNGDGTFQTAVNYALGNYPYAVAVGDFNGDAKPDLAVATGGGVLVLLNNDDGTFRSPMSYGAGSSPYSVAVGDFNADGKLDLAVANMNLYSGTVSVLLGKGNGIFQTAVNYSTGVEVHSLALGDFDGDGKLDFAVANKTGVSVLLGLGGGTFQGANFVPAGFGCASWVALGDFNGDGQADLVVGKTILEGVVTDVPLLLGKGDGTFQTPLNSRAGYNPSAVAVADFNGDGRADLVTANSGSGDVSILLGNGDGTVRAAVNYWVGAIVASVAAGDFNGDGKPDLAVATGAGVSVLLNDDDGTFSAPVSYGGGGNFVTVADLYGDGKLDLISVPNDSDVSVFLGKGDGSFRAAVFYSAGYWLYSPSVTVGDFNGDGKPDLAVTGLVDGGHPGSLAVLMGNGDGSFQTAVRYLGGGSSIAVGDFNGDGQLDLVTIGSVISVLLGNGDGTFQMPVTYDGGGGSLAVGDFNSDGKPDLAVAICSGVSVLMNTCASAGVHLDVLRSTSKLTLSWALPYANFILESTSNFNSTNWQRVPETITTNNGRWEVAPPLDQAQRYFRLRKP